MRIELEGGKYTYIFHETGGQEALRYGEKWRDLTGDKFVYLLAAKIESLTTKLEAAEKERDEYKTGWEKASEAYRLLRDIINTTMENFK